MSQQLSYDEAELMLYRLQSKVDELIEMLDECLSPSE